MNNSRSQTKIRKTQTLNLVAEQRYLKNKGLLRESSDDFMECFDQLGLTMDQLPARCMSITTKEDFVACKNEINQFVMQSKQNLVPMLQKFFTCMEGKAQNMDNQKETILFRVIQECLQNIIKHAQATQVEIAFAYAASALKIEVRDNGKGFLISRGNSLSGLGMMNMHHRIELMRGKVTVESEPGFGTKIVIELPLT